MKQGTKKFLKVFPVVILLVLCAVLVTVTAANRAAQKALPAMAGVETAAATTAKVPFVTKAAETASETTKEEGTSIVIAEPYSEGLVYRSLGNGTCLVCDMGTCLDSRVVIPSHNPAGETVVGLDDLAFRGCRNLTEITLPDTLTKIGAYAFYGSGLCHITLPENLSSMGEYVFCGCENLMDIEVAVNNLSFSSVDGVLFDKKGETLLCYPAGRSVNYYTLPATVREIRAMAFYRCDSIKLIHYAGDSKSFGQIRIGAGNEVVESAVITYTADIFSYTKEK